MPWDLKILFETVIKMSLEKNIRLNYMKFHLCRSKPVVSTTVQSSAFPGSDRSVLGSGGQWQRSVSSHV